MGSGGAPGICREGGQPRGHASRRRNCHGRRCCIWHGRWRGALTGAPASSESWKVRSREHLATTQQLLGLQGPPFTCPPHTSRSIICGHAAQPQE